MKRKLLGLNGTPCVNQRRKEVWGYVKSFNKALHIEVLHLTTPSESCKALDMIWEMKVIPNALTLTLLRSGL